MGSSAGNIGSDAARSGSDGRGSRASGALRPDGCRHARFVQNRLTLCRRQRKALRPDVEPHATPLASRRHAGAPDRNDKAIYYRLIPGYFRLLTPAEPGCGQPVAFARRRRVEDEALRQGAVRRRATCVLWDRAAACPCRKASVRPGRRMAYHGTRHVRRVASACVC